MTATLPAVIARLPATAARLPATAARLPAMTARLPAMTARLPAMTARLPAMTASRLATAARAAPALLLLSHATSTPRAVLPRRARTSRRPWWMGFLPCFTSLSHLK